MCRNFCIAVFLLSILCFSSSLQAIDVEEVKGTPAAIAPKDSFMFGFVRGVPHPYKQLGTVLTKRSAAFLLELQTTIDEHMTIELSSRITRTGGDSTPEDWKVQLIPETHHFLLKEHKIVTLWVKAERDVLENDFVQIEVVAKRTDAKGNGENHKIDFTVQMQAYETNIERQAYKDRTLSKLQQFFSGKTATFDLRLTNAGREPDEVEVSVVGPEGWGIEVLSDQGRPKRVFKVPGVLTFDIRTFTELPFSVKVTAPDELSKYERAKFTATIRSLKTDRDPPKSIEFEAAYSGLIMTASEEGFPFSNRPFRPHLVRPGKMTTYILQVTNTYGSRKDIWLSITEPRRGNWWAELSETLISDLEPQAQHEVTLTIHAPEDATPQEREDFVVTARSGIGQSESVHVAAEISASPKVYFVAIDGMNYDYLNLNRKGTALGPCPKEAWATCESDDWLMRNLHAFIRESTTYTDASNHLLSATDMNHTNALGGTYSGTAGLDSVSGFFYGRDEFGRSILRDTNRELMRYGPEGKRVLLMFDVAKMQNPNAFNVFVGGKNWMGELYRDEIVDHIVHGHDQPFYIPRPYTYKLGDPPTDEDADRDPPTRLSLADISIGSFFGGRCGEFPDDNWVMSSALRVIENEDPDVNYILMAGTDDVQHFAGVAWDLDEWYPLRKDTTYDDVSRYNLFASREEVLDVLREADHNFGRFISFLKARGTYDQSYIVLLADHGQVTHPIRYVGFRDPLEQVGIDILDDYQENFGGTSMGMVYQLKPELSSLAEQAIEGYKIPSGRFVGEKISPWIVFNRDEMKNGSYDEATGKQYSMCNDKGRCELYSEFYIEHEEPGVSHKWPSLYILYRDHLQAPIYSGVILSIGLDIAVFPEVPILIGGHGSPDTQHIPLILHGPGLKQGTINPERVYISDIAPTFYQLLNWPAPDNVDGKILESAIQ